MMVSRWCHGCHQGVTRVSRGCHGLSEGVVTPSAPGGGPAASGGANRITNERDSPMNCCPTLRSFLAGLVTLAILGPVVAVLVFSHGGAPPAPAADAKTS